MNLTQLQNLMSEPGADSAHAINRIPAPDLGSRLASVHVTTPLTDLAQCLCGLLLAPLPRPLTIGRQTRANRLTADSVRITHIHIARPDRTPACPLCFTDPRVCPDHTPALCRTPVPAACADCPTPVVPGSSTCLAHTTRQPWNRDQYLTLC